MRKIDKLTLSIALLAFSYCIYLHVSMNHMNRNAELMADSISELVKCQIEELENDSVFFLQKYTIAVDSTTTRDTLIPVTKQAIVNGLITINTRVLPTQGQIVDAVNYLIPIADSTARRDNLPPGGWFQYNLKTQTAK